MRILMLLSQLFTSGQTTHVLSLVNELHKMGHDVTLMIAKSNATQPVAKKYIQQLEKIGVHIVSVGAVSEAVEASQQEPYQVVHAHSSTDFQTALAIYESTGLPYILTCHGLGVAAVKYAKAFQLAAHIICVGPRIKESINRYASKTTLFQNTVDLESFAPGPKASVFTVFFAGRVDRHKEMGLRALVRATRRLPGPYRLLIAGNLWAGQCAGRPDEFLGWVPDVAEHMRKSHVVVGTGRTIREGMAAGNGCMVLGWSYDGLVTPDMIGAETFPDFSGRRNYPKASDVKEISHDLLRLYRNPKLLRELQEFGRSFALANLDQNQAAQDTLEIYRQVQTAPVSS